MIIRATQSPDDRKFIELIIYVARRSEDDSKYGAVKLNKILFNADFLAYQVLGRSITGHPYKKLPNGPAPKAILPILKKLKESAEVKEEERSYYNRTQKRVVALREPDLGVFSAQEIVLIDDVLVSLRDGNATQVSDLSHEFVGWKAANLNEEIPYQTALIDEKPEVTESDILFAESLRATACDCLGIRS